MCCDVVCGLASRGAGRLRLEGSYGSETPCVCDNKVQETAYGAEVVCDLLTLVLSVI